MKEISRKAGSTLYMTLLVAGGTLWSLAFALFALRYGPMLLTARAER